jgi:lipid-A-disaccharide synthase
MKRKLVMMVAGEPSGDLHGANLIRDLKKLDDSLDFVGAGGKRMKEAGLKGITNMEELAVVGFKEVFGKICTLRKTFRFLSEIMRDEKPDCFIPIDYPGFNLRMAKVAKEENIPVFYYISPQIWAWGKNRVEKIKKYVDKMLVILPFEEEFYSQYGVKVAFVGHPLLDIVKPRFKKENAFSFFNFNPSKMLIGILPGSRWEEVKLSLPTMVDACKIIYGNIPDVQFGVLVSENIDVKRTESMLDRKNPQFKLVQDKNYAFMNICDLLLVNSGTATLEAAILGKPMIVIYKLSFFSWLLGKMLIKVPNFGLVNIVAGGKIVPEFLQFGASPAKIAREALSILTNQNRMGTIRENLFEVKKKLDREGASERAARAILEELKNMK